ncbi:hypothetical protein [Enterococcus sp. DIV0724b]|uniref:hypothetical protein n=1 Tax=Enterococcus sp. DIV0724b TaxID=2774694 RepID=UPI003D301143
MSDFYYFFDASASWHGYSYQGKLAIFLVLKKLEKLLLKNRYLTAEEFIIAANTLFVELEYTEDIAFLNKEKKYIEIYQVKAGKTTKVDKKDSFNMFVAAYQNKDKYNGKKYELPKVQLVSSEKLQKNENISELAKKHFEYLINYPNYPDEKYPKIYGDLISSGQESKATFKSLLKRVLKEDGYTKDSELDPTTIKNKLIVPLKEIYDSLDSLNVSVYEDFDFSSDKLIIDESIKVIQSIKDKLPKEAKEKEFEHFLEKKEEYIFWSLVNYLDEDMFNPNVIKPYQKTLGSFLQETFKSLDEKMISKDMIIYQTKDMLYRAFNKKLPAYFENEKFEECSDQNESCLSCDKNDTCKFLIDFKILTSMEYTDLFEVLTRLAITYVENHNELNNFPSDIDIRDGLYYVMKKYPNFVNKENFYLLTKSDGKEVLLDINNARNMNTLTEAISEFSDKDPKFIVQLFESDFLFHISSDLSGNEIGNKKEYFTQVGEEDIKNIKFLEKEIEKDLENRINATKIIEIISEEGLEKIGHDS